MKFHQPKRNPGGDRPEAGAALLTTLVLVTAITLVVVGFFAVSRQEIALSGAAVAAARAELGEEAAFAEATGLLRSLTRRDGHLATLARHGSGPRGVARYTFLSIPDAEGIVHVPLFVGGVEDRTDLPNLDLAGTAALAEGPVAAPTVAFAGPTRDDAIVLPRLTGLAADGRPLAENDRPELGFVELPPSPGSPWRTRYTYWIEDLEGYPNLDLVGFRNGPDLDAMVLPGYGPEDSRAAAGAPAFALAGEAAARFRFPLVHRGQALAGQAAPGLSPREIALQAWSMPGLDPRRHPFAAAAALARERHAVADARHRRIGEEWREPDRFAAGLSPYLVEPLVPFGHGYPDEGLPRHNLNVLVANRDLAIADIVARNLPAFADRRGGLPPEEDYLATLAANAIDYADGDGLPSTPRNTENAGGRRFRGVDGYAPVNELFVRFEYRGYEDHPEEWRAVFVATIHAEFWNTFDRAIAIERARFRFGFNEPFRFRSNGRSHFIEEHHIDRNEPFALEHAIAVAPGEYKVHRFGEVRWKVPIPKAGAGPIAFPVVQDFRAQVPGESSRVDVRAHWELWLGGQVGADLQWAEVGDLVDSCGRKGASQRIEFGFFFPRHLNVMSGGEFFRRFAAPGLGLSGRGSPQPFGSLLGDPWMNYYTASTSEEALYRNKATPGARNFDGSKAGRHWFKDEVRVRAWPDRGYDPPAVPGPANEGIGPDEGPSAWTPEPGYAPWRLSQRGVYHSVTELGHLHDPVMWTYAPPTAPNGAVTNQRGQRYDLLRETWLRGIQDGAGASEMWGGGNTLRVGRPEHSRFDRPGMRASQWLDLFHVGHPGTNLGAVAGDDSVYRAYDPRHHQPPPAAPDPVKATTEPYSLVHAPELHAQGRFARVHGQLNLNTAPTRFEIETLLRGPAVSGDLRLEEDRHDSPRYSREGETGNLRGALREDAIPRIAEGLLAARPFLGPSHLARVFGELLERHGGLPDHHNDAEAEEPFARLFNATTLSSRHFRIHTAAEVYHERTGEVVGRARRVHEVFLRPVRGADGAIQRVQAETISSRTL